ncbi:hypothetical protein [Pseudomonas paralcaligenes]|uniref:hypothetical protein n=1 Tax=Pseudomonas paralcaligenes TaxID=2772558 RepID=UPI001C823C9C|nr:hypothetical protein [Pseudomonas paralcaligenes]
MSRIEPSRLVQILASLTSPQSKAGANARRNEAAGPKAAKAPRDISILRGTLKSRLKKLRQISANEFESAAPVVLVQEILLWEFGSEIAEHDAFKKATSSISEALQASPDAQGSLKRLINLLSEEHL